MWLQKSFEYLTVLSCFWALLEHFRRFSAFLRFLANSAQKDLEIWATAKYCPNTISYIFFQPFLSILPFFETCFFESCSGNLEPIGRLASQITIPPFVHWGNLPSGQADTWISGFSGHVLQRSALHCFVVKQTFFLEVGDPNRGLLDHGPRPRAACCS